MPRSARFLRSWRSRRLHVLGGGLAVVVASLLLGGAALAGGNNLLVLLSGAMLGLVLLGGGLSTLTLRGVAIERRVPRRVQAGAPAHLVYAVRNGPGRLPCFAVEVGESGEPERGLVASLAPGASTLVRVERVWPRRGLHALRGVTLSTSFPFGFCREERDFEQPDEVLVWPRSDRPVREPDALPGHARQSGEALTGHPGGRGEYRGLRPYRPGDDPRDVHWRSSARSGSPVVREYASEQSRPLWLCLDLRGEGSGGRGDGAPDEETAVEIAAALASRALRRGQPVGLVTVDERVEPGAGSAQLERVLDLLARARFRADAPPPSPPVPPGACVLVVAREPRAGSGWGDVYSGREPS